MPPNGSLIERKKYMQPKKKTTTAARKKVKKPAAVLEITTLSFWQRLRDALIILITPGYDISIKYLNKPKKKGSK